MSTVIEASAPIATHDRSLDIMLYVATLEGGGAERVFVRLANHYAARGHNVALLVNRSDGPIASLISPKVRVIAVGAPNAIRGTLKLVRILKREKPPAVVCGLTQSNLAMIMAAKAIEVLTGTRPRIMVCERNEFTTLSKRLPWIKRQILTLMVRVLYPYADKVSAMPAVWSKIFRGSHGFPRKQSASFPTLRPTQMRSPPQTIRQSLILGWPRTAQLPLQWGGYSHRKTTRRC